MNLIAFVFIILIQLCSNSSSEERREQNELNELNELWTEKRIAIHAFKKKDGKKYTAKSVLNYWASKGGAEMASFTWWVKPGQKSMYGNPAIIVDLYDENVKVYGFSGDDGFFYNPTGAFQNYSCHREKIDKFLRVTMRIDGYDKENDWNWKVSRTQSPKEGIDEGNLLSAKLRLRLSGLEYVDSEYNDKTFEKVRPASEWSKMDDANLGEKAMNAGFGKYNHLVEQKSFDFTIKEDLTSTFAKKYENKNVDENEMVLSFDIKSIKGIIYQDSLKGERKEHAIKHAKAMKAALKNKGIDVPILTFKDKMIVKSPHDNESASEESASADANVPMHQQRNGINNQSNGVKRGRVCSVFLIVFSVLSVLFV